MYVLCGALCMMMMAFEIDENFTKINMALVLRVRTVYAHTLNSWHNQPEPIGVITFCGENIIRLLLIDIHIVLVSKQSCAIINFVTTISYVLHQLKTIPK